MTSLSLLKALKHLRTVLHRLRMADLELRWKKCDFFKYVLHYTGHLVPGKGIYQLTEKLNGIENLPVLKVRQMLGLTGYWILTQ